jgi:hypothetical protein
MHPHPTLNQVRRRELATLAVMMIIGLSAFFTFLYILWRAP